MLRAVATVVFALCVGACANQSPAPLSAASLGKLQGKSVLATQYEKPDFVALNMSNAVFGMLGGAMMIAEGNQIVRENQVPDPAQDISSALQSRLTAAQGTRPMPVSKKTSDQAISAAAVVAANPGSDYVLDVKTVDWMMNYYPGDTTHYRVTYAAKMRLIDAATNSVVAEAGCKTVQGDDKNPPTRAQLLEGKAALLKSYLSKAAATCSDLLARDALKL